MNNLQEQFVEVCPVRRTLELFQGKWNVRVIYELSNADFTRFGELKKLVGGITNTMLTSTLRELETKGIVHRQQFNEIPPHVEYSLTESGKALSVIFDEMRTWGTKYL